jgi:DMSO/TMAO reductase YedYZ heme-binding membrane subunit
VSEQVWWYLSRSSGIVAWALLVASMLWGVTLAVRSRHEWVRPAWTFAVHRWLGSLTVVALGLHLGALVADSYVTFTLVDLVVPFASDYRPWGVALGVLSLWLVIAVQFSSRVLRRLPQGWWRVLHRSSYALILTVSAHAVLTGTDALRGFYTAATAALVIAPVLALGWRLIARPQERPRRSRQAPEPEPQPLHH